MSGHVAALAALLALASPARAHDRTTSYSTWEIRGRSAEVTLRLALLDATHFPWFAGGAGEPALRRYVAQHLRLLAGEAPCPPDGEPRRLEAPTGGLAYEWTVACPSEGEITIRSDLLLDVAPGHLHFARVRRDGAALDERVLSEGARTWRFADASAPAAADAGASLVGYVRLGIDHILSGYDHLAFLLALLLVEGTLLDVTKVVTGFTVGHSITLGLAILGAVAPAGRAIEALIGLSIALVAAEDLWLLGGAPGALPRVVALVLAALAVGAAAGHGAVPALTLGGLALFALSYFALLRRVAAPARLRWAVAFLFGLIHGFGFAGVLLEARLPAGQLAPALLGFNVGVELGQIGAVALAWPLLVRLIRAERDARGRALAEATATAALALGVFWFVTRAYG